MFSRRVENCTEEDLLGQGFAQVSYQQYQPAACVFIKTLY